MAKRLVAKVGEYEKNGETKGEYVRIGVILSNDSGEYALIDPTVNLAGVLTKQNMLNHAKGKKTGSSVMAAVFTDDDRQRDDRQQSQGYGGGPGGDIDDEIPFGPEWRA